MGAVAAINTSQYLMNEGSWNFYLMDNVECILELAAAQQ